MRRPHLFSMACVAAVAMLATASAQAAVVIVGSEVFGDEFTGSPNSTTLDATKWSKVTSGSGASVLLNTNYGPSDVEIYSASGSNGRLAHISTVTALNFGASPNDWWAQVKFKFPNQSGLWAAPNSPLASARQYNVLSGQDAISATAQGNGQGFDLRAVRYGTKLWALAWYGIDDTSFRIADILADNSGAGYLFSDTQSYSVSLHRKTDNTVDIYFDSTSGDGSAGALIGNKPLILGLNPMGMTIGDWSGAAAGYITVDAVRIGAVPEPASVCVWALVIGICGWMGWKRGVSKLFSSASTP